jgi:hypothetical protein
VVSFEALGLLLGLEPEIRVIRTVRVIRVIKSWQPGLGVIQVYTRLAARA